MSDEGDEQSFDAGGGDQENGGGGTFAPNPCCALPLGVILLVVGVMLIYMNEGSYVANMKSTRAARDNAKFPCGEHPGSCSSCDLSKVKKGDLVYVSCSLEGKMKLDDLVGKSLIGVEPKDLSPYARSSVAVPEVEWWAESYQWQWTQTKKKVHMQTSGKESGAMCSAASSYNDDNDSGAKQRRKLCCQGANSPGQLEFRKLYLSHGKHGQCQPSIDDTGAPVSAQTPRPTAASTQAKPTPNPTAAATQAKMTPKPSSAPTPAVAGPATSAPKYVCDGLNKEQCKTKGEDECFWNWDATSTDPEQWKIACQPTNPCKGLKQGHCKTRGDDCKWDWNSANADPDQWKTACKQVNPCKGLKNERCKTKGDICDWVWDKTNTNPDQWKTACKPKECQGEECNAKPVAKPTAAPTLRPTPAPTKPPTPHPTPTPTSAPTAASKPPAQCLGKNHATCDTTEGCKWDWTGDWKTSCVSSSVTKLRRLSQKKRPPPKTVFDCSMPCNSWTAQWSKEKQEPMKWTSKPSKDVVERVEYVQGPPAQNVASLQTLAGSFSLLKDTPAGVKVGGFTIGDFATEVKTLDTKNIFSKSRAPLHLKDQSQQGPQEALKPKEIAGVEDVQGVKYVPLEVHEPWTASKSKIVNECIVSSSGGHVESIGDLRLCFKYLKLGDVTLVGEVGEDNKLVVSKPQKYGGGGHLQSAASINAALKGYIAKDSATSFEALMEELEDMNDTQVLIFRVFSAIALWLAFYCFLSPISWAVEMGGDALANLPCCGDFLGGIAEVVEECVDAMVCVLGCCSGLACTLLTTGVMWIFFRPKIGVAMILMCVLIVFAMYLFKTSKEGTSKRRLSRSRLNPEGMELSSGSAQGFPTQAGQPAPQQQLQVTCPEGVGPGMLIAVQTFDGRQVQVVVPDGVGPGQIFAVMV